MMAVSAPMSTVVWRSFARLLHRFTVPIRRGRLRSDSAVCRESP